MKFSISVWLAGAWLVAAVAASAQGNDPAEKFGAREDIERISMSPDGGKVAVIEPGSGQGSIVWTMATEKGAKRVQAFAASGKPERLAWCEWISNERLVCKLYGVSEIFHRQMPFTRFVAINADGSNGQLLMTKQDIYSRQIQLTGDSLLDRVAGEDGSILFSRIYIPNDHLGSRAGSTKEGLAVDRIDTATLKTDTVERPDPQVSEYISDGHGTVRIKRERQDIGSTGEMRSTSAYFYRTGASGPWKPLSLYDDESREGFAAEAIDYEHNAAYGFRKKDGRMALYRIALDGSMKEELILARPDVDVDGLVYIGRRNRVVGVSYATDVRHVIYFDPALEKLSTALAKALPDQPIVQIVDASEDESKLIIWAGSDDDPGVFYLMDRKTREMAVFGPVRPQLEGVKLAKVRAITYTASDGTPIPAYLTLPPGGNERNLPAIVLPHGGPSARDEWGFDWLSQYYAQRGFAVLRPNFRGSSGYGDASFQKNGFRSWRVAIGDVLDGGRWLTAQGIADPAKLAIVGWSYGGYAALQSATVDPSLFKAVVAIAPVTDLAGLREESRNWADFGLVSKMVGAGNQLAEGSPVDNAGRIKVPVLLLHGGADSNVPISQSVKMDARLGAAGVPHELVTWPDLDHYLEDSAARAALLSRSDAFLRKAMGM